MHLLCIVKYFAIFHQIKDDAKNGLYVENVTEEYVTSYDDVTQILIKVGGVKCACVFCFISIIFHLFRVNHCIQVSFGLPFSMYNAGTFK